MNERPQFGMQMRMFVLLPPSRLALGAACRLVP